MTNNELGDAEARQLVDQEMTGLTSGATDVWVMLSEEELWDERGLMIEWLNQHANIMDSADFHGAKARLYHIK